MGEKGFIPLPDLELILRPEILQNLMCLAPAVTNSVFDFHTTAVTGDLSTFDVTTNLDYYQS